MRLRDGTMGTVDVEGKGLFRRGELESAGGEGRCLAGFDGDRTWFSFRIREQIQAKVCVLFGLFESVKFEGAFAVDRVSPGRRNEIS